MAASRCAIHKCSLICPSCVGAKGGKLTAQRHGKMLSKWGRLGAKAKQRTDAR